MPEQLIKDRQVIEDNWQMLDAEQTTMPEGPVIIPLAMWEANKTALATREQLGICLNGDEPPERIADALHQFQVIAINFGHLTDGRGFSYARELREHYGYKGEIRATGNFMRDQLFYLQRCGFNAFALHSDDLQAALASFADFSDSYQACTDQPVPLFKRR